MLGEALGVPPEREGAQGDTRQGIQNVPAGNAGNAACANDFEVTKRLHSAVCLSPSPIYDFGAEVPKLYLL